MNELHFTGTIVGGPYDGKKMTFNGTQEKTVDEVLDQFDKLKLGDHVYKVIEFDREKMDGVFMW